MLRVYKGITYTEIIFVVAIFAIIGASTAPFISNFVLRSKFDSVQTNILSSLRKAQNYSISGKSGLLWGVCFDNNGMKLYSGSCLLPVTEESYTFPASISVSDFGDITFDRRGEPSASVSISIVSDIESSNISINGAGGIYD